MLFWISLIAIASVAFLAYIFGRETYILEQRVRHMIQHKNTRKAVIFAIHFGAICILIGSISCLIPAFASIFH